MLGDFSMSRIRTGAPAIYTDFPLRGLARFMAPELLFTDDHQPLCTTDASDVYALAMTFFELGTGESPFADRTESQATEAVQRGERPSRPESFGSLDSNQFDFLWVLMVRMWTQHPKSRLSTSLLNLNTVSLRDHVLNPDVPLKSAVLSLPRQLRPRRRGTDESATSALVSHFRFPSHPISAD